MVLWRDARWPPRLRWLLWAAAAALIALRLTTFAERWSVVVDPQRKAAEWRVLDVGRAALCEGRADTELISNYAYVFRIECAAPVRHLGLVRGGSDQSAFASTATVGLVAHLATLPDRFGGRSLRVAVMPGRHGVEADDLPLDAPSLSVLRQRGMQVLRNEPDGLVLAMDRLRTP